MIRARPPDNASQTFNLRPQGHTYSLPSVNTSNSMKRFITSSVQGIVSVDLLLCRYACFW